MSATIEPLAAALAEAPARAQSRRLFIDNLDIHSHAAERRLRLEASPDVRAQVGRNLDLEDVRRLDAEVAVRPWLDGMAIEGRVEGIVTRLCGVTLEPFDVVEYLAGRGVDALARLRHRNAPRRAMQQPRAQARFEHAHALAHIRG